MIQKTYTSLFAFVLLFLVTTLYSQITIQGIVTDVSDNPITGALVEVINEQNEQEIYSNITSSDGSYIITTFSTAVEDNLTTLPTSHIVMKNYPNPFNPETMINFNVAKTCRVQLVVYDIQGRTITTLVDENYSPGRYEVKFVATDLPSGLYFYKIRMRNFQAMKKMMILK